MKLIKNLVHFVPQKTRSKLKRTWIQLQSAKVRYNHKKALTRVQHQKKIKVAFFLINQSMWKYERLYFLLQADKRFEPIVFICPFKTYGEEILYKEMENSYNSFKENGYKVVKTIQEDGKLLDVKNKFKPDLV